MPGIRKLTTVAIVLFTGACGGGDPIGDAINNADGGGDSGESDASLGEAVFGDIGEAAEGGRSSLEVVGAPTVTAEPGHIVVEVDGQRLEYPLVGSTHPMCDVTPETIRVNVQQTESGDLSLVASPNGGSWIGSINLSPSGTTTAYGADLQSGTLGIGDNAISYEGPMNKVVDFDIVNAETVEGTIAVNCDSAGGDPTATVGNETYTFAMSGAQSIECTVTSDTFEIRINRLSLDGTQLEMQGRTEGDQWVGAIVIYTADGNPIAQLPPEGTGLVIDGGTVTFEGTFTNPDGTESTGTATATCFE